MQTYLKADEVKNTQIEACEVFNLRCRVTNVKANFKAKFENIYISCVMKMKRKIKNISCIVRN